MRRPLFLLAVPLAVLAFLAAGCGGSSDSSSSSSDTSPTEEWAGNLCTAIVNWTTSLSTSMTSLQSGDLSKEALQGVADDAKSSTETLIDDLKGLGRPDTEAGAEAQTSLNELADDLQTDVDEIQAALSDTSASTLSTISTVSTTLVTMGNQLTTTFGELEQLDANGELEAAFTSAESCGELTN